MAFVVGLDLGTRTIKGAVFSGTPRSFRLVDFFVEDIPLLQDTEVALGDAVDGEEMEAILSPEEILQRVLEGRKLTRSDVYAALDAKDCGIRDIPFPYTREDQIQKTVAFEAEHYFHAFDIDDVTLEWVKVGEAEGLSHLILIAARNSQIEERLALLKRADVDPIGLDLDSAALANAFTLSSHYDETKNTLLVDMGATSAKVVLLEQGRLKKIRSLRTGSAALDPGRMIPEPLAVDPTGEVHEGGQSGDSALESRFREFESALLDLDLGAGDRLVSGGDDFGSQDSRGDAPIAILPDDEYERVAKAEVETQAESQTASSTGTDVESVRAEAGAAGAGTRESDEAARAEATSEVAAGVAVEEPTDEEFDYRSYLDRVGVEIQRTLAATQLDAPIELICLTGGMSRREEARRYFEESFEIETVRLDFRESLETDLDPAQLELASAEGAVAVGLAAKGFGRDLVGFDFRKGPYRYEHRLERLRVPLLVCAVLCFFVFLQMAFWNFHRYRYLKDHAVAYEASTARVYKTFFDKPLPPGRNALTAAQKAQKDWEAGGLSDVGRFLPFVDVVRDVSQLMASIPDFYFKLNSISYKFGLSRVVRGQGRRREESWRSAGDSQLVLETDDSNGHLKIQDKFNRSPGSDYFTAETQSSPQASGDYKVTVKLKVADKVLKAPASGD